MLAVFLIVFALVFIVGFVGRETYNLFMSTKCPHCRTRIDKRATVCPQCGTATA